MSTEKRFALRILSPVHIGCDEVYEPTGFVIDEVNNVLQAFDALDFLRSLSTQDKERMAAICGKGSVESVLELYKFMKGRRYEGHSVTVCAGLVENYRKTLSMSTHDREKIQRELNNFSIARTAFNTTTQQPYIPGSAVKGALRTAYLNGRQALKKLPQANNRKAGQLEQELLDGGSFASDPFRLLKVSDFHPLSSCTTKILYAVNEKKNPSKFKARGPYQTLEVIEPGAVFMGTIQIQPPATREVISTPITEESLVESAGRFYGREKAREDAELKEAGLPFLNMGDMSSAFPLRIGRHSGAVSLTIEGHRNIKIMKGRGERPVYSDKATTFWLAADSPAGYQNGLLKPFGWVAIGNLTKELEEIYERANDKNKQPRVTTPINASSEPAAAERAAKEDHRVAPRPDITKTPLEKVLEEMKLIKPTDAGRMGPLIQRMKSLESGADRREAAMTFKEKLGKDLFKKSKFKGEIEKLLESENAE